MQDPLNAGLLGHAKRWSAIGLAVGLGAAFLAGGMNMTLWSLGERDSVFLPLHSWGLAGIVMLVVCSFVTQVAVRVMIYLRRVKAEVVDLRNALAAVADPPPPDDGLSPEVIAIGRSLSSRLTPSR